MIDDTLIAYCDGSGTVAHLPCGAGVVVYDDGAAILEASRALGCGTNNHAELSAVRVALAITDTPELCERKILIRTDSMYAIGSLTRPDPTPDHKPNARLIRVIRGMLRGRDWAFEHVRGRDGGRVTAATERPSAAGERR